jgi:hypothetical protein
MPIFDRPMTKTERQRRWRARKAGKPLPVDLNRLHRLVDQALERVAEPGLSDDERAGLLAHCQDELDREFAGRPPWMESHRPHATAVLRAH